MALYAQIDIFKGSGPAFFQLSKHVLTSLNENIDWTNMIIILNQ
jgi:hypothetical protein